MLFCKLRHSYKIGHSRPKLLIPEPSLINIMVNGQEVVIEALCFYDWWLLWLLPIAMDFALPSSNKFLPDVLTSYSPARQWKLQFFYNSHRNFWKVKLWVDFQSNIIWPRFRRISVQSSRSLFHYTALLSQSNPLDQLLYC